MIILIDGDKMRFVKKHQSLMALSCFAYIEIPNTKLLYLDLTDENCFKAIPAYKLALLYMSTFNKKPDSYLQDWLSKILHRTATHVPTLECNIATIKMQADSIDWKDDGYYQYIRNENAALELEEPIEYHFKLTDIPSEAAPFVVTKQVQVDFSKPAPQKPAIVFAHVTSWARKS